MNILRTPEERFKELPDFDFRPQYVTLSNGARMHYVDEGPKNAPVVLMLHGEPTWSFSWRHVIKDIAAAGFRAIAPDHIGFGRSDKLAERSDYSYANFKQWMVEFVKALELNQITLACQDWGGPIGLSTLAAMPERFDAVVVANTLLPNCQEPPLGIAEWPGEVIDQWAAFAESADDLPVSDIVNGVCVAPRDDAVKAAYDAPFPDKSFKAAVLEFPVLIPRRDAMAGVQENRAVWGVLEQWQKPFVTAFSDGDPTTIAWETVFQSRVPGAKGAPHTTIKNAGHFVQEEQGAALAKAIVATIKSAQ